MTFHLGTAAARLALLAALASCARQPPARPALLPVEGARLTLRALTAALPLADSAAAWASAGRPFHWRLGTGGGGGLIATLSVAGGAPRPGAPARRLAQALGESRIARCEAGGHILVCARPLNGAAALAAGRVVVSVRDRDVVGQLRQVRPASLWRSVWVDDKLVASDNVPLVIADQ